MNRKKIILQKLSILFFIILNVNTQEKCYRNNQCNEPYQTCQQNECVQKPIFPMELMEFLGFIFQLIFVSLTIAAGLGGGIIVIPILLVFFRFDAKKAVGISNFIILINAFLKYMIALRLNDPKKPNKKLIDYQMILIFNPIMLIATVFGSIINKILPDGLILILLLVVGLAAIGINIYNGLKRYKQETQHKQQQQQQQEYEQEQQNFIDVQNQNEQNFYYEENNVEDNIQEENKNNRNFYLRTKKYEQSNWDPIKIGIFIFTLLVIIVFNFFIGTKKIDSILGFEKCSTNYWVIIGVEVLIIIIIYFISIIFVKKEIQAKKNNQDLLPHEFNYTLLQILYLSIFVFIVGVISIILGLGGGIILFPIFTHMGIQPLIASNTIITMVFISKIATIILNATDGLIVWDYAIFLGVFLGLSGLLMNLKVTQLVKKFNRQSLIIFLMIIVVLVGLTMIVINAIIFGVDWKFKSYC